MPLNYRPLGRTGLQVSPLCLGTMNFGWQISQEESFAVMDRALEAGLNFFDTADIYGFDKGRGLTEEIIGRWLQQGGGRRDSIVLATKCYNPMDGAGRRPEPNRDRRGLSALKIIRHCEDSLRRLQVDCIDLYQMHHVDRLCPWDEIWEAMETLIRQGKIIYVGASNFAAWDLASGHYTAKMRGLVGLVSEQSHYNLLTRQVELEVLPCCRGLGIGLIPWSPLRGGLLGGILQKPASGRRGQEWIQKEVEKHRPALEKWEALCARLGHAPADVGIAWLLHQPGMTAPIVGPRSVEQLNGGLRALDIVLDTATLAEIDAIFPGPGGEAPKAYAW